jgi:alanyl-tRNA synthetase
MSKFRNLRGVQTALLLTVLTVFAGGVSLRAIQNNVLPKDELKTLVANAKTAQDHERLAAHFNAKADQLDAEAKEHTELATEYRAHPTIHEMKHKMSGQTAGHCDFFAADLHKAAQQARAIAGDHAAMAKEAK